MKELVETVCKSLVDNPEEVRVTQIDGEQTTILELRVHQSDLGKVIGKQGRTARAIRTILAAAGMKQKRRFNLEIIERFEDREDGE
ncbi:MAG: KH domain-containing protein [Candidatus Omnitrophota bacterium]